MAILVSPGVDVQIIDESFYGTSGPGTIPFIVFATANNKLSPTGAGTAIGTTPANAGKLFLVTSQRELVQTFGNPHFYSVEGTQLHGYELNEYGLHAAYQYLGLSNLCYAIRADIDLAQLVPSLTPPRAAPPAGTYWLDVVNTKWGVFQSNGNSVAGNAWQLQPVTAYNDTALVDVNGIPLNSVGQDGDYAVVTVSAPVLNALYEKISGAWFHVGTPAWVAERPTKVVGTVANPSTTAGDTFMINGSTVTLTGTSATSARNDINSAGIANITATLALSGALTITNTTGADIVLLAGSGPSFTSLGLTAGTYDGVSVTIAPHTQVPQNSVNGDIWIKTTTPNNGANFVVKLFNGTTNQFTAVSAPLFANDLLANGTGALGPNPAIGTLYVQYNVPEGVGQNSTTLVNYELRRWNGTAWSALSYEASATAPDTDPAGGTFWYSTNFKVDIMYGDGENWHGYRRQFAGTDPNGVIISGSRPVQQSAGGSLVDNDIWLDSSNLEAYPSLFRYNATTRKWTSIDNTDQTTPFGIVFGDARADSGPTFTGIPNASGYTLNSTLEHDLALSDYVDPDAPDPRTFPAGTLLFNTRYSTYNVKTWQPNYFEPGGFDPNDDLTLNSYNKGQPIYTFPPLVHPGRWVTASGNNIDGSPYMGRKAQRILIVQAMAAIFQSNQDIRSELVNFNLMACPGYTEMIPDMVQLNTDMKQVSFCVADTPARLTPDGTSVTNWAGNVANVASDGDNGLVTHDDYVGLYYPWGLSTNIDGTEIMVPPSTIALRVMAQNDQVAYPWFAPAGFERGLVTNATSVGYLSSAGEFTPVILNQGQRDVLYTNKINAIAFIPGRGLVVWGQKTLAPTTTALDRINVARLANYLKYHLDNLLKPFLFEQNDSHTQNSAKTTVERFLQGLTALRALHDFAVVCDATNNTPDRIDQNQLWIDILIQPLKAIEFIYVPVRIEATSQPLH